MSMSQVTVLLTRPEAAARRFADRLDSVLMAQISVVYSPLIEIRPVPTDVDLSAYRGVLFTSANGVAAATDAGLNRDLTAFCVGPATTRAARDAGWAAEQSGQTAEELVEHVLQARPAAPLIHLRGRHARGDISAKLTAQGIQTDDCILYDQCALALSDAARTALRTSHVIAPLFSPRTARLFRDSAPKGDIVIAALSQAVADELDPQAGWPTEIADQPNAQAMGRLVEKLAQSALPG